MFSPTLTSRRTTPLALSIISLCAGCAMLPPKTELSEINPVSAYEATQSLAAKQSAWPSDHWWAAYRDPQLSELIKEGLSGANDMKIAAARLEIAYATLGSTRGALFPTMGANAKIDQERQSYNYLINEAVAPKGWKAAGVIALDLNWEIDFWGKNRAALAAAKGETQAAEAEAAAARLAVSTGIAQIYAQLVSLYADKDATSNAIRVRKQTVKVISDRFDKRLENESALERVRSAEASTQARLAAIDEQIALTRNQIAAMLGKGPDRGLAIKRPHVSGGRYSGLPKNLPLDLIGRRPDVVAARLRAEASIKRVEESRAAFYPNVNITAVIGKQALGLDLLSHTKSTYGSVGPAISLPILEGGRHVAGLMVSQAKHEIAVATYNQALAQALKDVADSVVSKRQLSRRLYATQKSATAAENAHRIVKNRYDGGLATYLEVLAAEDAMISARNATAALRARSFALDVKLVHALGGGFRSTEKKS
ncbi:efflux transporter outer membrane subunit [Cohaesibacter celericrescens]|uniref:Multidrug transporter n=1 Tax=Cohaesibacter celericrescens TaxID=2067669 RepID=A0A2N5XXM3_9HYPH|nr:efflux transporter outer membrane subunit [Cohaesibacter celericrescens]PLW79229.1 multidrug transporter [Cohaesibacter celericrescens]